MRVGEITCRGMPCEKDKGKNISLADGGRSHGKGRRSKQRIQEEKHPSGYFYGGRMEQKYQL